MAQEKKPSDSQERVEEFNSDKRHEIGLNVINAIGGQASIHGMNMF
jgi:hypothetical protein